MKNGFTLLELSIVLVIIGLIIGGITAGADLIRAAELNAVASDVTKYKVAVNTFKLKYNAMPGDMNNAQSYWPTCIDNGANVCNGDGNGRLESSNERVRFWQHLSLGGVINGNYLGYQVSGLTIADNVPFMLNNPLDVQYLINYLDKTDTLTSVASHIFYQAFDGTEIYEAEMIQLDVKNDDGLPDSGMYRMRIEDGSGSGCLTNTSPAEYDFSTSGNFEECYPMFLL